MIVIPITNKTVLVRHWLRWYSVSRGATDWKPLKIQRRPAPFDLKKTINDLEKSKKAGKSSKLATK